MLLTFKFLGIMIDDTLMCKTHSKMITPKLSSACYAIRAIKPFVSQDILKMMYHSYFHSVMKYGIILWVNCTQSKNIFRLKKRVVRIIVDVGIFQNIKYLAINITVYIFAYALCNYS